MAIKFETFDIPDAICEQEVSAEQEEKIAKRLAKVDASLRKKMKKLIELKLKHGKNLAIEDRIKNYSLNKMYHPFQVVHFVNLQE